MGIFKKLPALRKCLSLLRLVTTLLLLTYPVSAIVMPCFTTNYVYSLENIRVPNVIFSSPSMSLRSCINACLVRTSCEVISYSKIHRYCELGPNKLHIFFDVGRSFQTLFRRSISSSVTPGDACSFHNCGELEICVPLSRGGHTCVTDATIFTSDNRYNGMLPLVVNITSSNTTYEWCLHTCLLEDCPAFFFGNSQCYVRRERISVHFRYVPGMSYYERTGALGNVAIRGNTEASFTPCDSCKEATSGARLTTTYPPIDRDPCFTTPITSDNPYILITLWRKVFVTEVAILTREDGPPESGDQFFGIIIVYVQDDAGEWKLCTSLSGSGGFGKMFNQKCRAPLIAGQVVKVYKYHLDCLLSLCEVEIYGYI